MWITALPHLQQQYSSSPPNNFTVFYLCNNNFFLHVFLWIYDLFQMNIVEVSLSNNDSHDDDIVLTLYITMMFDVNYMRIVNSKSDWNRWATISRGKLKDFVQFFLNTNKWITRNEENSVVAAFAIFVFWLLLCWKFEDTLNGG